MASTTRLANIVDSLSTARRARRAWVAVALACVHAVGMGVSPATVSPEPAYAALPPCATEDSASCYWDASARGNGEGRSFYTDAEGNVYYVIPAGH